MAINTHIPTHTQGLAKRKFIYTKVHIRNFRLFFNGFRGFLVCVVAKETDQREDLFNKRIQKLML